MKYVFLSFALVGWFSTVQAEQTVECSQMENARERLACYDRLNPRSDTTAPLPKIRTEVLSGPNELSGLNEEEAADPAPVGTSPTHSDAAGHTVPSGDPEASQEHATSPGSSKVSPDTAASQDNAGRRTGGIFDWPEKISIKSKIAAVRSKEKQKMVFRLENGQIWMQSSPRELPIRTGDEVTIKSGTVGGYILRTSSGTSTRVKRVE